MALIIDYKNFLHNLCTLAYRARQLFAKLIPDAGSYIPKHPRCNVLHTFHALLIQFGCLVRRMRPLRKQLQHLDYTQ